MNKITRRDILKLAAASGFLAITEPEYLSSSKAAVAEQPIFSVSPYISDLQFDPVASGARQSFYCQPWRSFMETVPSSTFLNAIGINYNLPNDADDEAVIKLLSDCGIRSARIEEGWGNVPWSEDTLSNKKIFVLRLKAMAAHDIRPLVVLNAHHGAPCPNRGWQRTVTITAAAGENRLTFDSVADFVEGYTGLSGIFGYLMAGSIFTKVDPLTNTVQLSKALPKKIDAGTKVSVNQLKYLPFYPVETPQFEETASGWLKWVNLVLDAIDEAGVRKFDIEIWNELSFGSAFTQINNYYDVPIIKSSLDSLHPSGSMWEIARRTASKIKEKHSECRVIWGFSNTTFFHTPISQLPAGIDGQSYHPYGTSKQKTPNDYPEKNRTSWFIEGYIPQGLVKCMPEGYAHLGLVVEDLMKLLRPQARNSSFPPGNTAFIHAMTEHGFSPVEAGISTRDAALQYKAKSLIRALLFWINKGISLMDIYCAYEPNHSTDKAALDLGMGLLFGGISPKDYGKYSAAELISPALQALKNVVKQFNHSGSLRTLRTLSVDVSALGRQTNVFEGDDKHPALPTREMFTFLPFQDSATRFVCGVYVMTYDITAPMSPMEFLLTLKGIQGKTARIQYYDPISDAKAPCIVQTKAEKQVTITLPVLDYPRLLIIENA